VLTVLSKVASSFTGHDLPVKLDDLMEQSVESELFAPLLARILITSEKQCSATVFGKTRFLDFLLKKPWTMWIKLLNCGQHITFPTRDAKGTAQSNAVLSRISDISGSEKFTGHLPVKTGSYLEGKLGIGYIGGPDSVGNGTLGMTAGDISIGSKSPVSPEVGSLANTTREVVRLWSACTSCAVTSRKLGSQMTNKINRQHKEPATI
jgi:hypothetical protein